MAHAHALKTDPAMAANTVADGFLDDLAELSRAHGIGIADGAQLYVMESEDEAFGYRADDESRLIRA